MAGPSHLRWQLVLLSGALPLVLATRAQAGAIEDAELAALLNPESSVSLGLALGESQRRALSRDDGLGNHQAALLGRVDLKAYRPFDAPDPGRFRLRLETLGQDLRWGQGEWGQPGLYQLRLEHQETRFTSSPDFQTPLVGAGSAQLLLPAGFAARTAAGPSALPRLAAAFRPFALAIERRKDSLAVETSPFASLPDARLFAHFSTETRSGAKATGALSGSVGGSAMILPEPISTRHTQFGLRLHYGTAQGHLGLAYQGSLFDNDLGAVRFQNPFRNGLLENRLSPAPSNQAHGLKLDASTRLGAATRLSFAWSRGWQTQNAAFVPYATSVSTATLPQASLQGRVETESRSLQLTTRPGRDLSLLASYRYDDRDNQTPINRYTSLASEFGAAGTSLNRPYRRQKERLLLTADYRWAEGWRSSLGVEEEAIHRSCKAQPGRCLDAEDSRETAAFLEGKLSLPDGVEGKLGLRQSQRRVGPYQVLDPTNELAGMRKFLLADRDRQQAYGQVSVLPAEALALTLRLDLNRDDYRQSRYGLQAATSRVAQADLAYTLDEERSLYGFLSQQHLASVLDSRYSGANQAATEQPANAWNLHMADRYWAMGAGLRHRALLSGKLDIGLEFTLGGSTSRYQMSGGTCVSSACNGNRPQSLPPVINRLSSLRADLGYALDADTSLILNLLLTRQRSEDYAYALATTAGNRILGTGESPGLGLGSLLSLVYQVRFR